MLQLKRYPLFEENLDVLKNLSIDTSSLHEKQYVTESQLPAVNFDRVKDAYTRRLHISNECACSVDALLNIHGTPTFVEFKNGKVQSEQGNIKNKVRDSLLILCDVTGKHISYTRSSMDFILVYNAIRNPMTPQEESMAKDACGLQKPGGSLEYICQQISRLSKREFVRFNMEPLRGMYFKEVHTFTIDQFQKYLQRYNCY